jgi:hypothetical protein
MRLRKGPVIAALYPVAVLVLQALVAAGLGFVGFYLFLFSTERFMALIEGEAWLFQSYFGPRVWFGLLVVAPLSAWVFLRWCARRGRWCRWRRLSGPS